MCNFSGKLIAWIDHELPEAEAINVEQHVRQCPACRRAVGSYQEISDALLTSYEAAMSGQPRRKMPVRTWGAVAAAALILLAILFAQPRAEKLSVNLPAPPHPPAMAFKKTVPPAPTPPVRARRAAAPRPQWVAEEPTVEVALPAEALFPPGAVPAGFSFIADVRFQP